MIQNITTVQTINIQNIKTVQADYRDITPNNSTNKRSWYKTLHQYKQTIKIQNLTTVQTEDQHKNIATVLTDDQHTKHSNSASRGSEYKT
jgi:hypothetical protein